MERDWQRVHREGSLLHRELHDLTADATGLHATTRMFAAGLEQINLSMEQFEARTRRSVWNFRVRHVFDPSGRVEQLDKRSARRGVQALEIIAPYVYESCRVPELMPPCTLIGPAAFQGIILDANTLLYAGPDTPAGRPTGWMTRDPAIVERALKLWEAIRSLARPIPRRAGLPAETMAIGKLVARGLSNRDIADRVKLSPRSVERHILTLERHLEVADRTALAALIAGAGR